jgi:predicted DNA-binding protein YlxM (UPF0122 family)
MSADNEINAVPAKQALIDIIKKTDNKLSVDDCHLPLFVFLEQRTQFLYELTQDKPVPQHKHPLIPN